MLPSDQNIFRELINKTLTILFTMANHEEYKIGRFIGFYNEEDYFFSRILKIFTYAILLFSYVFSPSIILIKILFIKEIFLLTFFFIVYIEYKTLNYNLAIYSIKRKRFLRYQKQMNLIINNKNIHLFLSQNKDLSKKIKLISLKIDYIINVLKPPLDLVKKYQFIGFFSLIIPILTYFFQNIILSVDV